MSDFYLGLKQFLLEQTTTSSVFVTGEEEEVPSGYQMSQPSTVTSLSSQPMVKGKPVSSQGHNEYKRPGDRRGDGDDLCGYGEFCERDRDGDGIPDDIGEFDVFAYDADEDLTWPQSWDEYNDWFHYYFVAQQETMLQTLFLLSGTNSISGLSGALGSPGGFSTVEEYLQIMYWVFAGHPELEGVWSAFGGGGICWGCQDWFTCPTCGDGLGDLGFPTWPGFDYVPTWGG